MPLTALPCIVTMMIFALIVMMTVLPLLVMMTVVAMIITCPVPTFQIVCSIFHDAFPLDTDHVVKLIKHIDLLCSFYIIQHVSIIKPIVK